MNTPSKLLEIRFPQRNTRFVNKYTFDADINTGYIWLFWILTNMLRSFLLGAELLLFCLLKDIEGVYFFLLRWFRFLLACTIVRLFYCLFTVCLFGFVCLFVFPIKRNWNSQMYL